MIIRYRGRNMRCTAGFKSAPVSSFSRKKRRDYTIARASQSQEHSPLKCVTVQLCIVSRTRPNPRQSIAPRFISDRARLIKKDAREEKNERIAAGVPFSRSKPDFGAWHKASLYRRWRHCPAYVCKPADSGRIIRHGAFSEIGGTIRTSALM